MNIFVAICIAWIIFVLWPRGTNKSSNYTNNNNNNKK